MCILNIFLKFKTGIISLPNRVVYQGGIDSAPRAPESFKSPEKQSLEDRLNEVAAQSPSEIFNDAISAGSAVKAKYTQNATVLAGLAYDNPLANGSSASPVSGTGAATGSTIPSDKTGATTNTTVAGDAAAPAQSAGAAEAENIAKDTINSIETINNTNTNLNNT